jgi:hypothetical protein
LRDAKVVWVGKSSGVKGKGEDFAEGEEEKDEKEKDGSKPERKANKPRRREDTEKFLSQCFSVSVVQNFVLHLH